MRHGQACDVGAEAATDAERFLTTEGRRKSKLAGIALRALGVEADVVLASPYVRAKETAELVADGLDFKGRLEFCEALKPPGSAVALVRVIRQTNCERALVVGHEPFLSAFIGLLIAGSRSACVNLKKGAVCKLSVDDLQAKQCATLEWLMTSKQLTAIR